MRPGPPGTTCFHALTLLRFFAATPCLWGRLSHGASYLLCLLNKPVVATYQGDTSGVILSWYSLPHTDNQTGREGWETTEIQRTSKLLQASLAMLKKRSRVMACLFLWYGVTGWKKDEFVLTKLILIFSPLVCPSDEKLIILPACYTIRTCCYILFLGYFIENTQILELRAAI